MSLSGFRSCNLAFAAMACLCAGQLMAQSDSLAPPAESTTQAPSQSAPAPAQPNEPLPAVTIRQNVRRVIVDVMVRDHNGKPVHGLTEKDFSITEDKQPQRVLSFDVYDFEKASISRGPNAPALPPNVFLNVPAIPERGPLYVILYDLVNMEMDDQMTARPQILKFIASKPEGTRFAVFVNSDELYLAQGFTADRDELYASLDSKHARTHVPRIFMNGRNYGKGDPYTAIDVLTHIGQYLDGIPGRKNLIWVAGTFPAPLFPREGDPVDAQYSIKAETNALAQAEVAVFPLNVRGVVVNCEGCMTGAMPHGGAGGQSVSLPPGQAAPNALSSPTASPVVSGARLEGKGSSSLPGDYMIEDAIASSTGGRAFYSDNDLKGMLETATEDGGNYYTLTYSPSSSADDGKCHHIGVKMAETGYTVSYRNSYCRVPLVSTSEDLSAKSDSAALTIPLAAGDVLQGNMKMGAPMVHDLIFSAHVRTDGQPAMATAAQMDQLQAQAQFFLTHRRNKPPKPLPPTRVQHYTVDYRVLDPQFKMQALSGRHPTLEFAMAAFDADGRMLNGVVNDGVPQTNSASDNKAGLYRVRQRLMVPANAVSIRVGVRDRLTDRLGTLEVPLPLKPEPVAQATPPQP